MASWITHLRIADKLMRKMNLENNVEFILGNLAPDCGMPVGDGFVYIPDKKVTHYQGDFEDKIACDYEEFIKRYMIEANDNGKWFYLGYLCHLLTDVLWGEDIYFPLRAQWIQSGKDIKEELTKLHRQMLQIDRGFLEENEDFSCFDIYRREGFYENVYIREMEKDVFQNCYQRIVDTYVNLEKESIELLYVNGEYIDQQIDRWVSKIEKQLSPYVKFNS